MFTVLFSGCSTLKTEEIQLYDIYNKLSHEAIDGDIVTNRYKYFTAKYLKEVSPDDINSVFLLKLSNYIHQEISHYKMLNNTNGCLSINGTDENKEPLSLHIEYKLENGIWLVNYIFVHFLENTNSYVINAACPRDVEKRILDTMHND